MIYKAAIYGLTKRLAHSSDLSTFLDSTIEIVKDVLGVEFVKIMEHLPDQHAFFVRSAIGWETGIMVQSDPSTHAGFTMMTGSTICFSDLTTEKRFQGNIGDHLTRQNIKSGMAAVIGDETSSKSEGFGLILCHSQLPRTWEDDEIQFLEEAAGLIQIGISKLISGGVLDAILDPVVVVNESGYVKQYVFI
jgi:GAF domain-containing protein